MSFVQRFPNANDLNYTITSLNYRLIESPASENVLASATLEGNLIVSGGELSASSSISRLVAKTANAANITLTGPMSYDGVNITGTNVSLSLQADTGAGYGLNTASPITITMVMDLSLNTATGVDNNIVKALSIHDTTNGIDLELSGFSLTSADFDLINNVGDLVYRAGLAGNKDLVTTSGTFVLPDSFERLTLTGNGSPGGTGNAKNNILTGNAGNNVLLGLGGNDTLKGNAGDDTLKGGIGNDSLVGGDGDDFLNGEIGNDTMVGGAGNDTYVVNASGDVVIETSTTASEIDSVRSSITYSLNVSSLAEVENLRLVGTSAISGTGNAKANTLIGNAKNNSLSGLDGNDVLIGNGGDDTLNGGNGDDLILGGGGNDVIIGGAGKDALNGGSGNDVFKFVKSSDGMDTINDFVKGQDKLVFVSANFGALPVGALVAGRFVANTSGLAGDADDRFIFETDTKTLRYDANGSGAGGAVVIAKLNINNLAATDIVISAS